MIKEALLVEDDNIQIKLFCNYLWRMGYRVEVTEEAREAIHLIQNKPYALIITDFGFPDQRRESVIQEIRKSEFNQKTPLIVCTAYSDSEQKQVCLQMGAEKLLIKPVFPKSLKESIEECFLISKAERKDCRELIYRE